jgi:hypothetical protein
VEKFWLVKPLELVKESGHNKSDKIFESRIKAEDYYLKHIGSGEIIKIIPLFLVTVSYKSGNKFTGLYLSFEYKKKNSVMSIIYEQVKSKKYYTPIYLNVDDIESIWLKDTGFVYYHDNNEEEELYRTKGFE